MTELIKTYKIGERPEANNPKEVYDELKDLFDVGKEFFFCIHLDSSNKIICREIVHIGGLNSTLVDPKSIFRNAISLNANSIILAHNHPSGNLNPSKEDLDVTKKLKEAGELLQIKILDHIIFNHETYKSIMEN